MKINILALASHYLLCQLQLMLNTIADPYLYYSVGGGRATTPTIIDPNVRFGFRASSSGFACGNFDPKAGHTINAWAESAIRWQTLDHCNLH